MFKTPQSDRITDASEADGTVLCKDVKDFKLQINPDEDSIAITLELEDSTTAASYKINGVVGIRNSYVLKSIHGLRRKEIVFKNRKVVLSSVAIIFTLIVCAIFVNFTLANSGTPVEKVKRTQVAVQHWWAAQTLIRRFLTQTIPV